MNYETKGLGVLKIFALIGVIMIGSIIGMAISENKAVETTEPMPTRVLQTEESSLGEEMKETFMYSCVGEDFAQYDFCLCSYNYLDSHFTNSEIIEMSVDIEENSGVTQGMIDAVTSCQHLYNY